MQLLDAMQWRYATKKMNGSAVPEDKVNQILEAAYLAPTSSGLQPFRIFVITDSEMKAKIQPIANGQSQITDCSHLLVFAAWNQYTPERINGIFEHISKERGLSEDAMKEYGDMLIGMFGAQTAHQNFEHAARQAYLAFGLAIAAAAELRVDSTPMEGFNNAALDEFLDLEKQGLKSVVILPLGYRDEENDWLAGMKKVRSPKAKFVLRPGQEN